MAARFPRPSRTGFDERRTSAEVAGPLETFRLEVHRGIDGTGVVGVLRRGNGNRSVGIGADMDALPVTDERPAAQIANRRCHARLPP